METIIKEIPVSEIHRGDQIFGSSGAVATTDKGYWITAKSLMRHGLQEGPKFIEVSYENNKGETRSKSYPIDGFVFVKQIEESEVQ